MKIIHTGDWHMGERLGVRQIRLGPSIERSLERIASYLQDHEVDVLLVAGDVFCERSSREEICAAVGKINSTFRPFLERGGTIIMISGNHDSEIFFRTMQEAMDMAVVPRRDATGVAEAGRLYLASRPRLLVLRGADGTVTQFILMPYPTTPFLKDPTYHNAAEQNQTLQQTFKAVLETLRGRIDTALPAVLVSHIHVRGVSPRSGYKISENEDVIFEPSDIPSEWAYVAYGHIHQAQTALPNAGHIRYCGSIERLDAGERDDEKSVVLVEIGPGGRKAEPHLLPLDVTPMHKIVIDAPDVQMLDLAERYPDAATALVRCTLHYTPGVHNVSEFERRVYATFPLCYECELAPRQADGTAAVTTRIDLSDVRKNVTDYLTMRLKDDQRQECLLSLATTIMEEAS